MTLVLELSSEEEARLAAASRLHGMDPTSYAKQLVTEQFVSEIARPLPSIPHDKQTREYIYED
jgi:hypothetical protein